MYYFKQKNSGKISETFGKHNNLNNIMDLLRGIEQNILY